MKTGICPTCGQTSVQYENAYKGGGRYIDTLWCIECGWFMNGTAPGYTAVHERIFPPLPEPTGYWDNRCAAISPVGRVSGCGTRVEGHCDGRD